MRFIHHNIISPNDIKHLDAQDREQLCVKIKHDLLGYTHLKQGHVEASLGVVSLTVALHYVFDILQSPLIWDVGHQSYCHKMLTGRYDQMEQMRTLNGVSGFPKMEESPYDAFGTGHASTSISAAMGMALAQIDPSNPCLAVIGDASLASGMALEAINHLYELQLNVWIIINDNNQGIDPSIGYIKHQLNGFTECNHPDTWMGLPYLGPLDGNDVNTLIDAFKRLKVVTGPKIIHVKTQKKLLPELKPKNYKNSKVGLMDYQEYVGNALHQMIKRDHKVYALTPAMISGSGLSAIQKDFPERLIDTGITEPHAVTMAAGMAAKGLKPFLFIYSTFFQRAIDQWIHDVALQKLPVVIGIDRAGLVGEDGETHQGVFDIVLGMGIPNTYMANASNYQNLQDLLALATQTEYPLIIRYPRGKASPPQFSIYKKPQWAQWTVIQKGEALLIVMVGDWESVLSQVSQTIYNQCGITPTICHAVFHSHIDAACMKQLIGLHRWVVTIEDGIVTNGFGSMLGGWIMKSETPVPVMNLGIPKTFVKHAKVEEQLHFLELDALQISNKILKFIRK